MKHALLAALALSGASACDVYDSSLLVDGGDAGAPDVPVEACNTCGGATCVNLQTALNNCGKCGKTCETGCAGGLCVPTQLASSMAAPHGVLVNGSNLYVAESGSFLDVMSSADGTGLKHYADGTGGVVGPDRLATDGTNLFWTDNVNLASGVGGSLWAGSLNQTTKCNATSYYCYYSNDLPAPYGIAVQAGSIFATTTGTTNNSGGGCPTTDWVTSVLRCSTNGCEVTAGCVGTGPTVLATGTQPAGIAADATNVYWADLAAKTISYCPQPGCTGGPKPFAQNLGGPFDVISDGTTVFFSDRVGGALYSCPTTGCGQTKLAGSLNDPLLITSDGTTLYATLYQGGSLIACTLPDCAGGPVTLATGLHHPYGVTTDANYVYWTEEGSQGPNSIDGSVSKLRKK